MFKSLLIATAIGAVSAIPTQVDVHLNKCGDDVPISEVNQYCANEDEMTPFPAKDRAHCREICHDIYPESDIYYEFSPAGEFAGCYCMDHCDYPLKTYEPSFTRHVEYEECPKAEVVCGKPHTHAEKNTECKNQPAKETEFEGKTSTDCRIHCGFRFPETPMFYYDFVKSGPDAGCYCIGEECETPMVIEDHTKGHRIMEYKWCPENNRACGRSYKHSDEHWACANDAVEPTDLHATSQAACEAVCKKLAKGKSFHYDYTSAEDADPGCWCTPGACEEPLLHYDNTYSFVYEACGSPLI